LEVPSSALEFLARGAVGKTELHLNEADFFSFTYKYIDSGEEKRDEKVIILHVVDGEREIWRQAFNLALEFSELRERVHGANPQGTYWEA